MDLIKKKMDFKNENIYSFTSVKYGEDPEHVGNENIYSFTSIRNGEDYRCAKLR